MRNIALILTSILILTSCGAGRTMIMEPVTFSTPAQKSCVTVVRGTDTVAISESVRNTFESQLNRRLFNDGKIQNGPGVTLQYRFIQHNEGNRFARYMLGGIGNAGEASVTLEVAYFDENNNYLGKIQSEGKISSGLFGGSSDNAIETAADEVATYTRSIILQ